MAEKWFVIFDRREQSGKQTEAQKFEKATLLGKKDTAPLSTGQLEDACVQFVETENAGASGILEAQQAVRHFYPGLQSGTPVVVTTAAFKES